MIFVGDVSRVEHTLFTVVRCVFLEFSKAQRQFSELSDSFQRLVRVSNAFKMLIVCCWKYFYRYIIVERQFFMLVEVL